MRWLDGITDSEGQGSLACCSPWVLSVGHDLATEQQRQTGAEGSSSDQGPVTQAAAWAWSAGKLRSTVLRENLGEAILREALLRLSLDWDGVLNTSGFPSVSDRKESACSAGDLSSIPGLGISPEEETSNPLQYPRLENPTDRGAWCGQESDETE